SIGLSRDLAGRRDGMAGANKPSHDSSRTTQSNHAVRNTCRPVLPQPAGHMGSAPDWRATHRIFDIDGDELSFGNARPLLPRIHRKVGNGRRRSGRESRLARTDHAATDGERPGPTVVAAGSKGIGRDLREQLPHGAGKTTAGSSESAIWRSAI